MIAGVAAGLGDYFQVDPIIVRIVFVLLAFAGGAGVLIYVLAIILMPSDRDAVAPVHGMVRRLEATHGHRWLGIVLVVVAAGLIVSSAHDFQFGIVWGLLLIVAGVLLFEGDWAPWSAAPAGSVPPSQPQAQALGDATAAATPAGAPAAPPS